MNDEGRRVFITGGTGYLGRRLTQGFLALGTRCERLFGPVRKTNSSRVAEAIIGNALDANSYASQISPSDTFVQLVGVAHPSPAKAIEFRQIDFVSASGAIRAAKEAGIKHLSLSIAHPAPMMKA